MSDLRDVFSNNLRKFRKLRGLTQDELAEKCRLSIGTIQSYEAKRRWPEKPYLEALAKALDIPETDLFALEEPKKDPLVRHKELADTLYGKPKENVSKPFQVNPVNTKEAVNKSDALLSSLSVGVELASLFLSLPKLRQEAILSWRQHPKWIQFIRAINDNFYSFGGECEILCN